MKTISIEALKLAFQKAADYGEEPENADRREAAAYYYLLGYFSQYNLPRLGYALYATTNDF